MLYLDSQDARTRACLRGKAKRALDEIKETSTSPTISRYIKSGFYGIFKLATEEDPEISKKEGALRWFRRAAQYSAIRGNITTIDCLFLCCHAVAAQRADLGLVPEAEYCLKEAKDLAEQAKGKLSKKSSDLRFQLWSAANFEVSGTSRIPANRPVDGLAARRILQTFRKGHYNVQVRDDPKTRTKLAIDNLNQGWRSGMPPGILNEYIKDIKRDMSAGIEDRRLQLQVQCAIANIRFFLGSWTEARMLAESNWEFVGKLEEDEKKKAKSDSTPKWQLSVPRWIASYTYFRSTALLVDFVTGMGLIADQWNRYYASIPDGEKAELIEELYHLTLNPIMAMPRLLILVAALKGSPEYEERYWPAGEYDQLEVDERKSELKWVECWYKQAIEVFDKASKILSDVPRISLDVSHAYAAFYFTLLHLDSQDEDMANRAKRALDEIKETRRSPTTSRYIKSGFYGIFELKIMKDPEEALRHFREAARLSARSGNRFGIIDFLFKCCHAVAAQRVEQKKSEGYLQPEVDEYLKVAEEVAKNIEQHFYLGLYAAAHSEVRRMRGYEGHAERLSVEARNKLDQTGERILRIFRIEEDE